MTGVMVQRLGTRPPPVERILPAGAFEVGDVRVSKDRALFALAVMAIAAGVWAITRFTRFGLLTRACAQSEKGAYVSGISPGRVAAANWMLSAVVCGCAGILIAPIVPLVPVQYTLFVVPALAVAVLGRLRAAAARWSSAASPSGCSSPRSPTCAPSTRWLPSSGLSELVPLVLLLLVLVAWAKPLPGRGEVLRQALGRAPRPSAIAPTAALGVVAGTIALASLGSTYRAALVTSLILAVIALSYVVVTGYSGQVSLAQLTLAGVAGFLVGQTIGTALPTLAPILAASSRRAALVGVVVGLPAVRIRGLPVAVVTLALAVAVEAVWFRNTDFVSSSGKDVDGPEILGLDLAIGSGRAYPRLGFCLLVLGVLVLTACGVARLRTSPLGAAMLAVKANERAAAAAGIDVVRTKVAAFAIAGFIAGIGGALLAYRQGNVTVDSFAVLVGLSLFATAYLAGITSVSGAVVAGMIGAGGLVFTFLDEHLSFGRWFTTIGGIGLVFTVVRNPEGIVGPAHQRIERWRQRRPATSPRPAAAPATPTPTGPARSSANGTPALELRDVSVQYGGVRAVDRVSFTVAPGSIVGLIGPNGAGKTSLIDAVSGFSRSTGQIMLDGRRIDHLRPFERSRAGLGRTFQSIELYDDMTAQENVQADDLLALLQLDRARRAPRRPAVAGRPPGGVDRSGPRPAAEGPAARRTGRRAGPGRERLARRSPVGHPKPGDLAAAGRPRHVAGPGHLRRGPRARPRPADRGRPPGGGAQRSPGHRGLPGGGPVIAEQLVCGYGEVTVVRPLDLEVRAGEVLALLGPNGAGKTTLLSTLAGILPRLGGRVSVEWPAGAGARRPLAVPQPDNGREHRGRPAPAAARNARSRHARPLPGARSPLERGRREPLRWRAADARAGPSARTAADRTARRRAEPRSRAGRGRVLAAHRPAGGRRHGRRSRGRRAARAVRTPDGRPGTGARARRGASARRGRRVGPPARRSRGRLPGPSFDGGGHIDEEPDVRGAGGDPVDHRRLRR